MKTLLGNESPKKKKLLDLYARETAGAFLNGIDNGTLPPDVTISVGAEMSYASRTHKTVAAAEAGALRLATEYAQALNALPETANMAPNGVPVNPEGVWTFFDADNGRSVTFHAFANRTCDP